MEASTGAPGRMTKGPRYNALKSVLTTWPAVCGRRPAASIRQSIMIVQGSTVRSRLLSPREAARLMGLPEDYVLPEKYNEAYHLVGDGMVGPVINFLAAHILEPILASRRRAK